MSLEGQAVELSDRVEAYEQAEMLRKVSEDDIIQRSAEDMPSKRSDEEWSCIRRGSGRNFESSLRRMRKRRDWPRRCSDYKH